MSVSIRLAKFGKRNAPIYRVVAATTRSKRNGKFLDVLGYFDPTKKEGTFEIDKQKFDSWTKKGAQVTQAVEKLIAGKYTYIKYNPKSKPTEKTTQEPVKKE